MAELTLEDAQRILDWIAETEIVQQRIDMNIAALRSVCHYTIITSQQENLETRH